MGGPQRGEVVGSLIYFTNDLMFSVQTTFLGSNLLLKKNVKPWSGNNYLSFSNVVGQSASRVQLFSTLRTATHQASLSLTIF